MSSDDFHGSGGRKDGHNPQFRLRHLDIMAKSPSPEFANDEESASICPLLTPNSASPSEMDPLAATLQRNILLEGKSPSPDFAQDEEAALLAPSPVDPRFARTDPLAALAFVPDGDTTGLPRRISEECEVRLDAEDPQGREESAGKVPGLGPCEAPDSSASSGSFALRESNPCADLFATRLYRQLDADKMDDVTDFIAQENCGKQSDGFESGVRLGSPDYSFLSWNWSLIRKSCFIGAVSLAFACLCLVIGMVATVPKRCYPPRAWYQGSVFYEIFPASFQDSDLDGVGDLRGIASRVDYLAGLGVGAVRLNSIFPSTHYPEAYESVTGLEEIEKSLGTMKDFSYLRMIAGSSGISLVLDLPIWPYVKHLGDIPGNETEVPPRRDSVVVEALRFWYDNGADGMYIKGLEHYVGEPDFLSEMKRWREVKESYRSRGIIKMLMCDSAVLRSIQDEETADFLLRTMDLLDVHLDLTNGTSHVKRQVNEYRESRVYDDREYSWLHWNIGNAESRRLSARVENNIGAILFELLLPGTVSIFYGDEIGLQEISDPHSEHRDLKHVHQLAPMRWSKNGTGFTRNDVLPWLPFAKAYGTSETLRGIVRNVTALRMDSPSIYMSSVWKETENLPNHAFRYVDQNVIVLERSYPRRKSYAVLFNIGGTDVQKDLSNIYYGGELVEDVRGTNGVYLTFNNVKLGAGESYIFRLDT